MARTEDPGGAGVSADVQLTTRDDAPRSFDRFYADEYAGVLRIVYALRGSWAVAEELTQDAFLRALRSWDEVAVMERPGGWVRRVACNLAISGVRRLGAEARAVARLARHREPLDQPTLREDSERFWQLVRGLPRRQAQVVALHYAEDRSIADIADILGVTEGTVKTHLHAARRRLDGQLALRDEREDGR